MPRNFTYSFQLSIKTFLHAYNAPNLCALAFANMAEIEIACKMGHFVSAEQFNIWRTQRVGFGQFFSTKLSGNHIDTYQSKLEYSNMELRLFKNITFFPPDPLLVWVQCRSCQRMSGVLARQIVSIGGRLMWGSQVGMVVGIVSTLLFPKPSTGLISPERLCCTIHTVYFQQTYGRTSSALCWISSVCQCVLLFTTLFLVQLAIHPIVRPAQ